MIRYKVSSDMAVLFVGINPHPGSFRRGVPFSNNKMFWYLLSRAQIINEPVEDLKDDAKLKDFYDRRFNQVYKLGFVNVVNRPTKDVSELKRGEERTGQRRIRSVIKRYKPRVVCFIGKIAYEKFSDLKHFDFGWQEPMGPTRVYVMHFPLRGKASVRIRDLKNLTRTP